VTRGTRRPDGRQLAGTSTRTATEAAKDALIDAHLLTSRRTCVPAHLAHIKRRKTVMSKPTIGRIVQYKLSADDATRINKRRADSATFRHPQAGVHRIGTGEQHHIGNEAREGDVLPMLIVRVWNGQLVNGQVFLDGNDVIWVTSVREGDGPRSFAWPPRA
jgi:hypothetical protein